MQRNLAPSPNDRVACSLAPTRQLRFSDLVKWEGGGRAYINRSSSRAWVAEASARRACDACLRSASQKAAADVGAGSGTAVLGSAEDLWGHVSR